MNSDWVPIALDLGPLPARRRRFYTLLEIFAAVHLYRTTFLAGRRSTDRLYRDYCRGKADTPALTTILRIGPLTELLQEVEQAGWEERVARKRDPRLPTSDALEQRRRKRAAARAIKPKPRQVLELIRDSGSATSAEISEALGYCLPSVRGYLKLLRDADMIRFTRPARSRQQRYVATTDDAPFNAPEHRREDSASGTPEQVAPLRAASEPSIATTLPKS